MDNFPGRAGGCDSDLVTAPQPPIEPVPTRALYPRLNPSARLLWRTANSVQLELGDRAVVLEGISAAAVQAITAADGTPAPLRDRLGPVRHALAEFLWPRAAGPDDPRLAPPAPRLAGELAALSARHGERGAEVLNARRWATVAIHGPGRVGPHIAAILAAAGIGRVYAREFGDVRLHQQQPGGLGTQDEATPFHTATAAAVHRVAPEAATAPHPQDERPDLVVLAYDEPIGDDRRDVLHLRGWTHLPIAVGPTGGVIGPLVIPGLTSCLRCADLHRSDRDPAWNALAVQLAVGRRRKEGSAVAAASVIAGAAAMQVLAYLDGENPAAVDGTIELHEPDWRLRRRTRGVHPDCGCHDAGR